MRRLLLAPLVLTLAACGSSGGGTSASDRQAAADAARVKFTKCMRDNGINVPDTPGQGARQTFRNVDRTKLQAAMKACQKYRDQAFGTITPQQRQEFRDAFVKFAACMRSHGVEVPDPGAGGNGPVGFRIDRNDPRVQAAMKACQSKLPRPPGGGRAGGPGIVQGAG